MAHMSHGQARTRGLNPLGALAFVRATAPDRLADVLAAMSKEDLVLLGIYDSGPKLSATSWVPFSLQARLLRTIDSVLGDGDFSTLFEVGRYMAQRDVPRVFRTFLRFGNPGWILEVSTRLWRLYHDRGRWELERTPVSVFCTLHDHDEADEAFCQTFQGWLTGAVEISGGYDVMVDHPVCAARGAPKCLYTTRWTHARQEDEITDRIPGRGSRSVPSSTT